MDSKTNQDKSRLSGVVLNALDDGVTTDELARQAYQSRTQFHRLFRAVVGETPAAMRRRLLLERAAFQLGHTEAPVTDIAFDTNYGSLEAFSRAFRKAFGTSPSLYRRIGTKHRHLHSPNGILYNTAAIEAANGSFPYAPIAITEY